MKERLIVRFSIWHRTITYHLIQFTAVDYQQNIKYTVSFTIEFYVKFCVFFIFRCQVNDRNRTIKVENNRQFLYDVTAETKKNKKEKVISIKSSDITKRLRSQLILNTRQKKNAPIHLDAPINEDIVWPKFSIKTFDRRIERDFDLELLIQNSTQF